MGPGQYIILKATSLGFTNTASFNEMLVTESRLGKPYSHKSKVPVKTKARVKCFQKDISQ